MMAADTMEALGFQRGQYVVKVNNRKVLDGVMDAADIPQFKRIETLRCLDKFDKFGEAGVRLLLTSGRKDESGDFTKGVGLTDQQANVLLSIFAPANAYRVSYARSDGSIGYMEGSPDDIIQNWDSILEAHNQIGLAKFFDPPSLNPSLLALLNVNVALKGAALGMEGIGELLFILKLVQDAGYEDRIRIDPSVVRGLEYYTGPVFEVELLIETKDEKGRPVRFGSVGGGGRYDGLVSRFRGEAVPATGFSIGVSRLQAALDVINRDKRQAQVYGPVVVTIFDRERIADYQKMVAALRNAGIRAELYLGNPKNMGNQLKYADRRNAPCVVIQGSDEKERGEVQIKDLIEGAKAAAAIASNAEWRESRPAQFSCKESELVDKVRDLLDQHAIRWN
jgi:histidyl-tRNA synthetase